MPVDVSAILDIGINEESEENMLELSIRFYQSASKKKNMLIDIKGESGKRYEINDINDIKNSLQNYIETVYPLLF